MDRSSPDNPALSPAAPGGGGEEGIQAAADADSDESSGSSEDTDASGSDEEAGDDEAAGGAGTGEAGGAGNGEAAPQPVQVQANRLIMLAQNCARRFVRLLPNEPRNLYRYAKLAIFITLLNLPETYINELHDLFETPSELEIESADLDDNFAQVLKALFIPGYIIVAELTEQGQVVRAGTVLRVNFLMSAIFIAVCTGGLKVLYKELLHPGNCAGDSDPSTTLIITNYLEALFQGLLLSTLAIEEVKFLEVAVLRFALLGLMAVLAVDSETSALFSPMIGILALCGFLHLRTNLKVFNCTRRDLCSRRQAYQRRDHAFQARQVPVERRGLDPDAERILKMILLVLPDALAVLAPAALLIRACHIYSDPTTFRALNDRLTSLFQRFDIMFLMPGIVQITSIAISAAQADDVVAIEDEADDAVANPQGNHNGVKSLPWYIAGLAAIQAVFQLALVLVKGKGYLKQADTECDNQLELIAWFWAVWSLGNISSIFLNALEGIQEIWLASFAQVIAPGFFFIGLFTLLDKDKPCDSLENVIHLNFGITAANLCLALSLWHFPNFRRAICCDHQANRGAYGPVNGGEVQPPAALPDDGAAAGGGIRPTPHPQAIEQPAGTGAAADGSASGGGAGTIARQATAAREAIAARGDNADEQPEGKSHTA